MPGFPDVPLTRSAFVRLQGGSDQRLARAVRSGDLARVRRGSYASAAVWAAATPENRHLLRVMAASDAARGEPVFSHESAALVWGIPVIGGVPERPQITVAPGSGLRSNRVVARHEAPLATGEIDEIFGIRTTSLGRTLVDVCAQRSFVTGVCAVEHVLHADGLDPERLVQALRDRRPVRGSRRVEAVLSFAGSRSASPNESLCRVRFAELGFPQPQQQREYVGSAGQNYSVDFYWPEFDVICEADGRAKYEDPRFLRGRTPQQALWEEKCGRTNSELRHARSCA